MLFIRKREKKPDLIKNKYRAILISGLLGWIVYLLGGFVDNIYSGRFLSSDALSAVQLISPFYSFTCFIACLCSVGFGVKYNLVLGKEGKTKADKIVGLGLISVAGISAILAILLFAIKIPLLNSLQDGSLYQYANDYFFYQIIIAAVYPLYSYFYRLVSIDGDPIFTVSADIVQVAVKMIASFFLMQSMGIKGLGLGTVLSMAAGLIIVLFHWLNKKNSIKFKPYFSWKELGSSLRCGFSTSVDILFSCIVVMILNTFIINKFGESYLATYSIISFVTGLSGIIKCVPDSASSIVGLAYGANNNDDIKKCIKLEFKWSLITAIIIATLSMALCAYIPLLYGINNSSDQYQLCYLAPLIIAPSFIFEATIRVIGVTNVSIGRGKVATAISIFNNLIFPIALTTLFALAFNMIGFMVGFTLIPVFSLILLLIVLFIKNKEFVVFKLNDINEIQQSFDFFANEKGIKKVCEEISAFLAKNNGDNKTANEKVIDIVDKFDTVTYKNNPNKLVTARITVGINKENIRLFFKNNGRILASEEREKYLKEKDEYVKFSACFNPASFKFYTAISFNYGSLSVDNSH